MLVANELACSCTGRCQTKTEHYVIKTAFEVLQQYLTGNAASLGSFLEHVAELTLQNTVCVFTLELKPGEIFGFLGPNGAGKTTTIKMIVGILAQDQGEIIVDGIDVLCRSEERRVGKECRSRWSPYH